jgi:hypothetical protein
VRLFPVTVVSVHTSLLKEEHMARTNRKVETEAELTHEGGPALVIDKLSQLSRAVCACLMWEDGFYESGVGVGARIASLVADPSIHAKDVVSLINDARHVHHLRHAPLWMAACFAQRRDAGSRAYVADGVELAIRRADELAEFVSLYAKARGVEPKAVRKTLSKQTKLGMARAFGRFDEYQIGKYDRAGAVRLRDAMFLSHPKPSESMAKVFEALAEDKVKTPDTWETALSGGADKRGTFERLLKEGRLGYMALLRNLRNMHQYGVDEALVLAAIKGLRGASRVLPFRFIAAARAVPHYQLPLDMALIEHVRASTVLPGRTVVLVDVSISMKAQLSGKSDLTRMDAAATLASVVNAEHLRVFSFSNRLEEVPVQYGLAGVQAIIRSQPNSGTELGKAIAGLNAKVEYDRLIVVSDEQTSDRVPNPKARAYMVNVAANDKGVGYGGNWTHVDGFSEGVLRWIYAYEGSLLAVARGEEPDAADVAGGVAASGGGGGR